MLEPTASRFWQATLQSGLAEPQALQACWDAIPPEKRTPEHIDRRLARQAVQSKVLTLWQAQQIISGRSGGFKIDRYVLLDLIGQGGMGRVYLALDSRLNRRVALKILSPERVNNPRAIARFHREALVGAQLQHENLVRIYDEGEAGGKCYLVMEFIEGKNIGQLIAEGGPIPPAVAARLGRQVALGLEHAQRKGLIHRDVNPYNILVTRDGTAKLTDMGLAIDLADTERVTRDGATVGTFDYVSPEQARHSHSVDTRSDIYSLGCTLYHMLSGQVPFPSASLPEKLFSHQTTEPQPLRSLVPAVPEGFEAAVMRMLRKSPDDRFATPLEVAQALEPFADPTPGPGHDPNAPSRAGARPAATVTIDSAPPTLADPATRPSLDTGLVAGPALLSPTPPSDAPDPAPPTPPPAAGPEKAYGTPGSDEDGLLGLGIAVDLGPELPLSGGSATARTRLKPKAPSAPGVRPASQGRVPWLVPAAAGAGLLAALIAGVVGYRALGVGAGATDPKAADAHRTRGRQDQAKEKGKARAAPRGGADLVVVSADGTATDAPDLATAVRKAIGSRGHVVLNNRGPLKVATGKPLVASGGAVLLIRAGVGVAPVLEVEVKGRTPFLTSRIPLRIEGVTVVVRYTDRTPDPPPVIVAGGDVLLDRCAFRVEGPPPPGARALTMEGGALTATGCWFENFDRALDVSCFGGSVTTLRQCMFVRTLGVGPDVPAFGWAVLARSMPGGFAKTGRKLLLDHCTGRGQGFLDLQGFSPDAPIKVDLTACAVRADALVSWTAEKPPTRAALVWSGQDDQYDVRGQAWLLLTGGKPSPGGPGDLVAWTKAVGDEVDPVPPPVKFETDPGSLSDRARPQDFAVSSLSTRPPGADPSFVGPGARPVPPSRRRP